MNKPQCFIYVPRKVSSSQNHHYFPTAIFASGTIVYTIYLNQKFRFDPSRWFMFPWSPKELKSYKTRFNLNDGKKLSSTISSYTAEQTTSRIWIHEQEEICVWAHVGVCVGGRKREIIGVLTIQIRIYKSTSHTWDIYRAHQILMQIKMLIMIKDLGI